MQYPKFTMVTQDPKGNEIQKTNDYLFMARNDYLNHEHVVVEKFVDTEVQATEQQNPTNKYYLAY